MTPLIDGLQYANWSEKIFREMRQWSQEQLPTPSCFQIARREAKPDQRLGTQEEVPTSMTQLPDTTRQFVGGASREP